MLQLPRIANSFFHFSQFVKPACRRFDETTGTNVYNVHNGVKQLTVFSIVHQRVNYLPPNKCADHFGMHIYIWPWLIMKDFHKMSVLLRKHWKQESLFHTVNYE